MDTTLIVTNFGAQITCFEEGCDRFSAINGQLSVAELDSNLTGCFTVKAKGAV